MIISSCCNQDISIFEYGSSLPLVYEEGVSCKIQKNLSMTEA